MTDEKGLALADGPWRAQAEIAISWGGDQIREWQIYSEAKVRCARHVATVTAEREADDIAKLIAAAPEMRDLIADLHGCNHITESLGARIQRMLERLGIPTEKAL